MLGFKVPWRAPSVALLPADQQAFTQLVQARNATALQLNEIEADVRQRAASLGADAHSRTLWQGAKIAGRKPEIDSLASAGREQDAKLAEFAAVRGFSSAERLAKVCGLPSPAPTLRRV